MLMLTYKKIFMRSLDEHNVSYTTPSDDTVLISMRCENLITSVVVSFANFDTTTIASFVSLDIINLKNKETETLKICNERNRGALTTFFVDEDGNVACRGDVFICKENCAQACMLMFTKVIIDLDEIYPKLARLKFL